MHTMKKERIAEHPGSILKRELEDRGLKQKDFANEIQIAYSQLNEIINGKRNITPDFALILESALGIKAIQWLQYQSMYDLQRLVWKQGPNKDKTNQLERWNTVREYIPYSFFRKMGFITGNISNDEIIIKELYSVDSLDKIP